MKAHYPENDRMPEPISLNQVHHEKPRKPILRRFRIPRRARKTIRNELFRVGIHEAMLFPEIDHQADYLERLWWYPEQRSSMARILDAVFRRA